MPEVGQATISVTPVLAGAQQKITSELTGIAGPAANSAGSSFGSQFASFAVKAIAAVGIGKAISDSISNGMNFETSMAKASTLFSGTSAELAELQDQILGISSATGVAASELAEAAYSAESASIPAENLAGALESSAKLATAGFTDIDTALSATAKTMNAYGMVTDDAAETQANMEKIQRILIQTQNKGITTVGELGSSLAQVTPTAAAFGVSFEQVGASLAGMTAQGTPTAQATTQLNSLIAELGKSGTTASDHFARLTEHIQEGGLTFAEAMEQGWDLSDVLSIMDEGAAEAGVSMVDMFSSIEAGKAAMSIWNSDWAGNMDAMATEADVVGEAYETMADTVSFKAEQIKTSLTNMGIEAFSAVADDLSGMLEGVSEVIEEITPYLEDLGGAFLECGGAVVDTIANMLGIDDSFSTTEKIAGILKEGIEGLTGVLEFLTEHMDTILPVATALGGAFIVMKSPLGGLVSGLGGLIGNVTGLGGAAASAAGPVSAAGASFGSMAGQALQLIAMAGALWITAQAISVLVDAAIRITEAGGPAIAVLVGMGIGIVGLMGAAAALGPALTAGAVGIVAFGVAMLAIGGGVALACYGISRVVDAISNLTEVVATNADGIVTVVSGIGETVGGVISSISEGIATVIDAISGGISGVLDSVAGIIDSIGEAALNAGTGFEKLASAVMNLVNNTGVLDLGATLATVAKGIKEINDSAKGASNSATSVQSITTNLKNLSKESGTSVNAFKTFGSGSKTAIQGVVSAFKSANLAASMRTAMDGAKSAASSGIESLKALFASTTFSFNQHIALPHFSMSGSFDAKTKSVPSVGVNWYKKAAEYGALFKTPQIVGVGDASQPELLIGEQKLKEMLGGNGNINVNLNYDASDDAQDMLRDLARGIKRYRMAGAF